MMPPSELPWPARNFVSECTTMSAPWSIGRIRYGVASVLSTIRGTPALRAIAEIASMSVTLPEGLAIDSMKIALVRGVIALSKLPTSSGMGPHHVPAETLERVAELVDRPAVQFARRDKLVAGHQQLLQHHDLCGVAGSHRKRRCAAFERRDAFFQHRIGRIADAGVDVAERLQPKQRGGVIGIVEHEGRGLIDRRRPGAGGRIGLRARVHGEGRKSGKTIGHVFSFMP